MRFQRYRNALAAIEHAGIAGYFDTLAAMRWGPREGRQELFEAVLERRGADLSLVSMMLLMLYDDEAPSLDDALAALVASEEALPGSHLGPTWVDAVRAFTYMYFGRFREGAPLLDSLRSSTPPVALQLMLLPILGGIAPDDVAAPAMALLDAGAQEGAPFPMFWRALVALVEGDTARVRTLLERAPSPDRPGTMVEEFQVLRGLYAVAMGDTAGGLQMARSALRRTRYGLQAGVAAGTTFTLGLLVTLVETSRPELRERAIDHLEFLIAHDPINALVLHSAIARAYEAAGLPDRAARLYSHFLRVWENADPEVQAHVDAARRELERLMAEGART